MHQGKTNIVVSFYSTIYTYRTGCVQLKLACLAISFTINGLVVINRRKALHTEPIINDR